MASLSFFALAVLCFVTVALGQIMPPDDDAPRVIIHGILLADTFTDGITVVHDGDISGTSMNVRGNLFGGDATFVSVTASDTTVGELTVTDLATLKGLNTTMLEVTGDASFGGNVAINGSITAGASQLNMTSVTELTVRGDANFERLLMAQSNIQVGADINVGGTSHFFGDALANMTATVEESLLVNGDAFSDALFVSGRTNATSAQVDERTRITELNVAENVDVGGNLYLGGDLSVDQSAAFKLALSANEASLMGNFHIGVNATVGGSIKATTGQFSNVDVKGSSTVSGTLTTNGYILVAGETTVGGNVQVEGDISAENMISAVAGDFQELDVDTATIVSLTSTFVTSTSFDSDAATVLSTFIVNGATTVDVLTVESTSTLNDVTADSVETDELEATTVTVAMLTVTGDATLNTMTVSTMLMAGRPSETQGWFASFEDVFVDNLHSLNSSGQLGMVDRLTADNVDYAEVTGRSGTFNESMITTATITRVSIDMANIESTTADEAQITNTTGDLITTASLFINDTGSLDHLFAETLRTQTLEGTFGDFDMATSVSAATDFLTSTNSTIQNLTSSTANITWLQSNTGTITRLSSVNAWFQNASSNSLVYTNANFSALTSTNFNASLMYNVTGGSSTNWFFAQVGKINETEARTLYVTDSAFFHNLTLNGDTSVEGSASFQHGFISGEALVSTLTVVGDTSFAELSVTGPAFLTDLWVKRVTITDSFDAQTAELTAATTGATTASGNVEFDGTFNVSSSDSLLKGNLVVQGTTQFQTGSFSRIGTAVITTTDMEAFNMDIANGLFGAITVDDLTVTRAAIFDRSIQLAPMVGSTSGSDFSFFSTINPIATRVLTADVDGTQFFVNGQTLFHSGFETIDQLVVTNPTNPGRAALRITGDGQLDFLDGSLYFRNLDIGGGVVFENEQNVAWVRPGVATTRTLTLGTSTQWFSYSDLIDRDLVEPGTWIDPARFSEPSNAGQTDLLTLSAGQYRVSGNVEISVNSPASADSIVVVTAGVDAFLGTESSGVAGWTADCVASFGVITGTNYGGSCFFSGILTVDEGEVMTLRTKALWNFSSATLANTLVVDPESTLIVEELFDRTSQNLS